MEPMKSAFSFASMESYEPIHEENIRKKQKHIKRKKRRKHTALAALSTVGAAGLVCTALFLKGRRKERKEAAPLGVPLDTPLGVPRGTYEVWKSDKASDGTTIAYEKQGSGHYPVVFLHGMYPGADREEWRHIAAELAKTDAGYDVYGVDLPGFGQSAPIAKPWTAYRYVNVLHDFLQDVVQKSVAVVAVGLSADIALMLSLLHPEDIQKLVLIAPEGIGRGFATKADVRHLKWMGCPLVGLSAFLYGTSKKRIRAMVETMFYEKERIPADFLQRVMQNARHQKGARVCYTQCISRFAACSSVYAFQELSHPFLLIWGEKNEKNPPIHLEEAEQMQEKGEFMLFEHTAELPHMENPKGFLQILQNFL